MTADSTSLNGERVTAQGLPHSPNTRPWISTNGGGDHTNGNSAIQETPSPVPQIPIAICGMGMRLPGGIRNDTDLYNFLVRKQDARAVVPDTRFNVDAYHNPHNKPGTVAFKHGYFLDDDVDLSKFDLSMFNMTAAEVERLDPNQRLLLEVVREAFESAGEADFRGKNIGTHVGLFSEDWTEIQNRDLNDFAPYQLTGKTDFMLSNRIAYEYDLKGPRQVRTDVDINMMIQSASGGLSLTRSSTLTVSH